MINEKREIRMRWKRMKRKKEKGRRREKALV